MNRDTFDKKLAQRMHSQEMEPDATVWSRIEASLDAGVVPAPAEVAPRRRTILPILSTVTAAAAILVLSFLLLNRSEKPTEIIEPIVAESKVTETTKTTTNEKEEVVLAQYVAPERKTKSRIIQQPAIKTSNETSVKAEPEPEQEPEQEKLPETVSQQNVRTRAVLSSGSTDGAPRTYNERFRPEKSSKGGVSINVGGAANFSSSSSVIRNNSGVMSPLTAISSNKNGVPLYSANVGKREWQHNIPLSFSVSVRKMFTHRIGLETGLTYTYLSSVSHANGELDQEIKQRLNYLGIPLSVVCSFADGKRFGAYGKVGFMVDKALSATAKSYFNGKSKSYDQSTRGVQCSSMLQIGGEYHINRSLSLYVEPTVSYYLDSNQPISYRTENNFGFSAMVGLRFNL